jgi:hypothetical protein
MNEIDNKAFDEVAECHEIILEESMKGICPVCRQPVEVIESCIDTLDIHYSGQGIESRLCAGGGTRPTS